MKRKKITSGQFHRSTTHYFAVLQLTKQLKWNEMDDTRSVLYGDDFIDF